jgi:two-component system response regulator YesN
MAIQRLNVFIVDDNRMEANGLRKYLKNRFGNKVRLSIYFDSESCLCMMHGQVNLVVLDYNLNEKGLDSKTGLDVLKTIKLRHPETEVVILTSNEDIGLAIDAITIGAKDFVVKGVGSWQRILAIVDQTVTQPIRFLVTEYGVTKFVGIFLFTFLTMGMVVVLALKLIF